MSLKPFVPVIVGHIRFAIPQRSISELRWIHSQLSKHYGPVLQWRDLISESTYEHLKGKTMFVMQVPLRGDETEGVRERKKLALSRDLEKVVGIVKFSQRDSVRTDNWVADATRSIKLTDDGDNNHLVDVEVANITNPFFKVSDHGDQWRVRIDRKVCTPMIITTGEYVSKQ